MTDDGPSAGEVKRRALAITREFAKHVVDDAHLLEQIRFLTEWAYGRGLADGRGLTDDGPPQTRARSQSLNKIKFHAWAIARTYVYGCHAKGRKVNRAEVVHVIKPSVRKEWILTASADKAAIAKRPAPSFSETLDRWLKEMPDAGDLFDPRARGLDHNPQTVGASKRRAGLTRR